MMNATVILPVAFVHVHSILKHMKLILTGMNMKVKAKTMEDTI
jgi:hypothetical protein